MTIRTFVFLTGLVLIVSAGWISLSPVLADEIYLKSGDLVEGVVIGENTEGMNVEVQDGFVTFKRAEITRVTMASESENGTLRARWEEDRKRSGQGGGLSVSFGKSLTIPFSDLAGFFRWLKDFHRAIHTSFMAFPPTAFILNLGPIAAYRRNQPVAYVLGFYSALLLTFTPMVVFLRNAIVNIIQARKHKQDKGGELPIWKKS